jgi:hypothetical protein
MYYGKGLKPWQIAMLNQKKTMYFSKPAMQDNQNDSEIVKTVLDFYSDYHHHKENMAYSGVLLQIGLFAGIMTASMGLILIWLLIHCFIGWQLQMRRYAAKVNAAAIRFLASNENRANPCGGQSTSTNNWKTLFQILSFIWPINYTRKSDAPIEMPYRFSGLVCIHLNTKLGTITEEIILLSGSLIMLGLTIIRTF